MKDNGKVKILLTDEHKIMRDGLKALFATHPEVQIVGEAEDCGTAAQIADKLKPDVITIGVNIGGSDNIETVRRFSQRCPEVKIVAHSMYLEKSFVTEMMRAGTCAYVHKEQAFAELVKAINAVLADQLYLCPKAANVVMNGYLTGLSKNNKGPDPSLTERERQVLKLLADGKSSKQIALQLHLSVKTVDTHRRQIMNKLGLYSLAELTKYAIRCGLTSLD